MRRAAALAVVLLLAAACGGDDAGVQEIGIDDAIEAVAERDVVVLDVRTPEEFADGHVPGAVNVPIAADDFGRRVAALDKDKTYLVMCARGGRSKSACGKMEDLKLKALYDFPGGMNAWNAAGKPVQKGQGDGGGRG